MKKHQNKSARAFSLRTTLHFALISASSLLLAAAPIARAADIISNGPVGILKGSDAINPRPGTQGGGGQFNSLFYVLPGEGESPDATDPSKHQLPNQPFFIAYEPTAGPVQTNDWWTGVGLQWYVASLDAGWAGAYNDGVIRSQGFISEPFYSQFVDFTGANGSVEPPLQPLHGLRLWNQNAIAVKTDGKIKPDDPFNAANNIVDRALLAPEVQAVVTVGLEGAHPIGTTKPTNAPWTNVRVRKYSDWGSVLAYKDGSNEMEITMANGSPFTWLERTQGQANFLVWAGGSSAGGGAPTVWQNQNGVLGFTMETPFSCVLGDCRSRNLDADRCHQREAIDVQERYRNEGGSASDAAQHPVRYHFTPASGQQSDAVCL